MAIYLGSNVNLMFDFIYIYIEYCDIRTMMMMGVEFIFGRYSIFENGNLHMMYIYDWNASLRSEYIGKRC